MTIDAHQIMLPEPWTCNKLNNLNCFLEKKQKGASKMNSYCLVYMKKNHQSPIPSEQYSTPKQYIPFGFVWSYSFLYFKDFFSWFYAFTPDLIRGRNLSLWHGKSIYFSALSYSLNIVIVYLLSWTPKKYTSRNLNTKYVFTGENIYDTNWKQL